MKGRGTVESSSPFTFFGAPFPKKAQTSCAMLNLRKKISCRTAKTLFRAPFQKKRSIILLKLYRILVVSNERDVKHKVFSRKEVEYGDEQGRDYFDYPGVAVHCGVAYARADRRNRKSDKREQQEFQKALFVASDIAVLVNKETAHYVVEYYGNQKAEHIRGEVY